MSEHAVGIIDGADDTDGIDVGAAVGEGVGADDSDGIDVGVAVGEGVGGEVGGGVDGGYFDLEDPIVMSRDTPPSRNKMAEVFILF